ncbi:MAG: tRNA (guanosine(46)-N7)-methyltransferase TrmB [Phycisphaeraceae bacterium]|nr:tRNA (guanosine(46)-N7)-methyltransferase TrmB [Phycisphaeraceae bacterium]MCW5763185.1 tRNA (guanosine(46)-N7)-methyltransferase TrmB [Phycisphaeraceae bacterium]
MSFGLGHGREIDPAPGVVGVSAEELPPLPDDALARPDGGWVDVRAWFENPDRPLEIEIGSGKGTFLIQQAEIEPETNFLGIEWAAEFYAYAADRVRRRREAGVLSNVRLLNSDATEFLRWRCPDGVARVIHLYFSDPWPKRRHHKKRVVQHRFLADAWRVLAPGGELRVVTDHEELWAWDCAHFGLWAQGVPSAQATSIEAMSSDVVRARESMPSMPFEFLEFDRPGSARAGELVGTNFERKFRLEGRSFYAGVMRKRV